MTDPYRTFAEPHALGALDAEDRSAFEAHLAAGCADCAQSLAEASATLRMLPKALFETPSAGPDARQQLLDLAQAPGWPMELSGFAWEEIGPGIRLSTLREDPARGMRACLAWVKAGAVNATHRHGGDECILVLQGALRDENGEYGPGQVCRSRPGSVHHEEAMPGEDCVCYVVYYGPLEFL
jgi:anti-sigma factor ChrR (cupin superfamily)